MEPLVSILIPTYNRPLFFTQAMKSALLQTYPNTEIIVCDNSDNVLTEQIVGKFRETYPAKTIVYVKNPKNNGPIANQHQCFRWASGDYVNYCMDDDWLHPEKITRMMRCIHHRPSISLVTSRRQMVDMNGLPIRKAPEWKAIGGNDQESLVLNGRKLIVRMLKDQKNYIGEPTAVLFRRKDLEEPFGTWCGKQAFNNVDVASWCSLLAKKDAVFLKTPLSFVRRHPRQLSKITLSKMGRLCDWMDHTIAAHNIGVFPSASALAHTVRKLMADMLASIPQWNKETNGRFADQWIIRVRALHDICKQERKLSDLVKPCGKLLKSLEKSKRNMIVL